MNPTCAKCGMVLSCSADRCHACGHVILAATQPFLPSTDCERKDSASESMPHQEEEAKVERLLGHIASQSHFEERYELREVLASGGMGQVHRAYDTILRRNVAIKMMRNSCGSETAAIRGQFLKEARVGGRLLHPHILPVFDLGVNHARKIYFTMRLVNGASLQSCLDSLSNDVVTNLVDWPLRRVVETFLGACYGVDYAHQNGVLHLDLKPHNILVSGFDEVFVIDWGLARVDDVDDMEQLVDLYRNGSNSSQSGSCTGIVGDHVVGTPGYMAPEQAAGDLGNYDGATDVYGLGGILYFILYGMVPNQGAVGNEQLQASFLPKKRAQLRQAILPRGRHVSSEFRDALRFLEDISLKALQPDRVHRYPSVEAMIIDLNQWLTNSVGLTSEVNRAEKPQPPAAAGTLAPPEDGDLLVQTKELTSPVSPVRAGAEGKAAAGHWQAAWKRRRSPPWWAAVALLLLVVGGVVVWRVWPPPSSPPSIALHKPQPMEVLHPGDNETVSIHIDPQHSFREEVKLQASCDGLGLTFRATDIPAGGDSGAVNVEVAPNAALGRRRVTVTATAEGQQQETSFTVVILPPGFEPGPGKDIGPYPERIVRHVDKHDVVFVLVQPDGKPDAPFYLMENKVCNGVFRAFARQAGDKLAGLVWRRGGLANGQDAGDHPLLPVFRVTRPEAERCAAWLGGRLPTARQLDLAFGYDDRRDRRRNLPPLRSAAVNRIREGPRKNDDPNSDDISPHGIRDLAGNGLEWTCDTLTPVDGKPLAVLRGRSYTAPEPLLFADLDEWNTKPEICPVQLPDQPSWTTGFRVVIELPGLPRDK